jgi:hypothetical protein
MSSKDRNYTDLSRIDDFRARYDYLQIHSTVGLATFGYERWLNQAFYTSRQWKNIRQEVIARDLGRDLGIEGYEIFDQVIIHHMNPINVRDLTSADPAIIDPEFLISTSLRTHNAIHYGEANLLVKPIVQRRPGDTKLW